MNRITFSPPKHRVLQPLNHHNKQASMQRDNLIIKKKMVFDKENYNTSNHSRKLSVKRLDYGSKRMKDITPILQSKKEVIPNKKKLYLNSLPYDIHLFLAGYLRPSDIISSLQYVNKYWNRLCNDRRLWVKLNLIQRLPIGFKFAKKVCIVERRSKGMIFKATSRLTGDDYIVRKVNIGKANAGHDDGLPTSILRELSYLSSIEHPNITKIKEVEARNDIVEICSEFHEYNLKEFMKLHEKKPTSTRLDGLRTDKQRNPVDYKMPLDTIKSISFQLLKGLSYLHRRGIIHRNLKCDNVLITKNHEVKISDFALSRLVSIPHVPYTPEDPKDRERSGREARRLWYRAPELLLRKSVYSFEIDMWAFGCLFAELASNVPLFNGDTEIEQLFKIFSFVGSPNSENWSCLNDSSAFTSTFPNWPSVYFPDVAKSQSSVEYSALVKTLLPNREGTLKALKLLHERIGEDGLDLLWQCLRIDPQQRPSAESILNHKFFSGTKIELNSQYEVSPSKGTYPVPKNYTLPLMPDGYLASYFVQLRKKEEEMTPFQNYIGNQQGVTEQMRCILIDWLIDVSVHFEVMDETLHYCVNYIDRYNTSLPLHFLICLSNSALSQLEVEKTKLQLVGVTCMKIADVFNERSKEYYKQENANEYAYITADEYTAQQLIDMEKQILNKLQFKLNVPTAMHFLKIYASLLKVDDKVQICAAFLCDLFLIYSELMNLDYSLVASGTLFLACKAMNSAVDSKIIEQSRDILNVFSKKEFANCVKKMREAWHQMKTTTTYASFDAVYSKYLAIYGLPARNIEIPTYSQQDLNDWFYTE